MVTLFSGTQSHVFSSDSEIEQMTLKSIDEVAPLVIEPPRYRNAVMSALSSLVFVVAFGMVTAYSAPATVDMSRPGSRFASDITPGQIAWIASLPALSGVVGNAVAGHLSQRLGRRTVLLYTSVFYMVGWLVIAYAPEMEFVYAGRLATGFCAGVCMVAAPAYVVEVSTVNTRGLFAAGFQTAFALGVFLVMVFGTFLRWSWLAVAGAATVVTGAALVSRAPESPPWLIRVSRNVEAFEGLRFLRGGYHEATKEFQEIVDNIAEEPREGLTLGQLLRPELYKPLIIAIALMAFQQFCGINALMSYSVELLQNSSSIVDPGLAATFLALVQVLATGISSLLMDRVGRRALYATSGIFTAFSLVVSGTYSFFFQKNGVNLDDQHWTWVPLTSFVTYVAAFSFGFGPIPFVVTPEMVPTHSRSFLLAVASVSSSFFSFAVTRTFDDLRGTLGLHGLYWTYATFTFVGVCFYWAFISETKGRTMHDIHLSFSKNHERY